MSSKSFTGVTLKPDSTKREFSQWHETITSYFRANKDTRGLFGKKAINETSLSELRDKIDGHTDGWGEYESEDDPRDVVGRTDIRRFLRKSAEFETGQSVIHAEIMMRIDPELWPEVNNDEFKGRGMEALGKLELYHNKDSPEDFHDKKVHFFGDAQGNASYTKFHAQKELIRQEINSGLGGTRSPQIASISSMFQNLKGLIQPLFGDDQRLNIAINSCFRQISSSLNGYEVITDEDMRATLVKMCRKDIFSGLKACLLTEAPNDPFTLTRAERTRIGV